MPGFYSVVPPPNNVGITTTLQSRLIESWPVMLLNVLASLVWRNLSWMSSTPKSKRHKTPKVYKCITSHQWWKNIQLSDKIYLEIVVQILYFYRTSLNSKTISRDKKRLSKSATTKFSAHMWFTTFFSGERIWLQWPWHCIESCWNWQQQWQEKSHLAICTLYVEAIGWTPGCWLRCFLAQKVQWES